MNGRKANSMSANFKLSRRLFDIILALAHETDRPFSDTVASMCWLAWTVLNRGDEEGPIRATHLMRTHLSDLVLQDMSHLDAFVLLRQALKTLLEG